MNFGELQQELVDRGFTYLSDNAISQARRNRWLNQGRTDLNDLERWPWLEATQTGAAPLTIADMREPLYVATATALLEARTPDDLADSSDPLLATVGVPVYYWRDGMTKIQVYPLNVATQITVRYLKVEADLAAATDTPIMPSRYHNLIVDFAAMRAYRDRSNFAEAKAIWDALQPDLARMREALLQPMYQRQTDPAAA